MQIVPTLDQVKEIASAGTYQVLPVSCEILSDFTTPIETMRILKQVSTHCYMLESAASHESWGRYTFLGFDARLEITCMKGEMRAGSLHFRTEDPSAYLRQILETHKSPRFDYLPLSPAVLWDISPTTIWGTASTPSAQRWRTPRLSGTWT